MPLYDYKCTACGQVTEVRHGFDDVHAEPCPVCGAKLTRVFNPAPIVFKGSGFYVTDSRGKSQSSGDAKGEAKPDVKTDAKTDTKPEAKADAKPAESAAAKESKSSGESAA